MPVSRACLALLAVAAALPAVAAGSFPGTNGPFVVSLARCSSNYAYLARIPSHGGSITPFTPSCDPEDPASEPDIQAPDASPDGTRVLSTLRVDGGLRFLIIRTDGSGDALVPTPAYSVLHATAASYAPDGVRFVFDDDGAIRQARLDREAVRTIHRRIPCGRRHVPISSPRWSPDGRLIAVVVGGCPGRGAAPDDAGIWLMRARDGRFVRRIGHGGQVDWSPDGRSLVYATRYERREAGGARGGNLYVVSRDGRHVRPLVRRRRLAETEPVWSPNGRWIAWVSMRFGRGDVGFRVRPSLWRVPSRGGKPERLQSLPEPHVDGIFFHRPQLTWARR